MKTSATVLALLLAAIGAQADSDVPASVHSVTSGGYWEAKGRAGIYRVVVINQGYEHVTSRVLVQWLQEPSSPNEETKVVSSVEPELPFGNDIASLSASLEPLAPGQVQVVISGVVSVDPSLKVNAVLLASKPGLVEPWRLTHRPSGPPPAAAELKR
jgi:hypothetical protein